MADAPVCFVVMPFGTKLDQTGAVVDFDLVYRTVISPAVAAAGMVAVRADEEIASGSILQPSLNRLIGSAVVVFDITTTNANVMYELGIRHAMRTHGTMIIAAQGASIPFDLVSSRVLFYQLNAAGRPENVEQFHRAFADHVRARQRAEGVDSLLYALFPDLKAPDLGSFVTDSRRAEIGAAEEQKRRIQEARRLGVEELAELEEELGDISTAAPDVVLTLFDAYRSRGAWSRMIELAGRMPPTVASSARVQEQLALALNRLGKWEHAEEILKAVLSKHGVSAETCGILGRVYKDQWRQALEHGEARRAEQFLDKAIDAYLQGFETDWRDPYPGVNAATLMTMREPPDPRREEILPVVEYGVKRKLAAGRGPGDYWDVATLLEVHILAGEKDKAFQLLSRLLAVSQDPWQTASTINNLKLIRESFEGRGQSVDWIEDIEHKLNVPVATY